MTISYLPRVIHFVFIALILVMMLSGFIPGIIVTICFYSFFVVLFRKFKIHYQDNPTNREGAFYSPVNGKVLNKWKIEKSDHLDGSYNVVQIMTLWWNEYGIYLPESGEVEELKPLSNESFFRINKENNLEDSGLLLKFRNRKNQSSAIQFIKCKLGSHADICVQPGDRGKFRSNIGHFPFGGTVLVYVPAEYELLIQGSDVLIAGETLLAKKS